MGLSPSSLPQDTPVLSNTPAFPSPKMGHTPSTVGLSGRNSRKFPERARKRSQSFSLEFPREYGWDPPNATPQGIGNLQSTSRIVSLSVRLGMPLLQTWFRRGPLRAAHGIPSSAEGNSDKTNPRVFRRCSFVSEAYSGLPNANAKWQRFSYAISQT